MCDIKPGIDGIVEALARGEIRSGRYAAVICGVSEFTIRQRMKKLGRNIANLGHPPQVRDVKPGPARSPGSRRDTAERFGVSERQAANAIPHAAVCSSRRHNAPRRTRFVGTASIARPQSAANAPAATRTWTDPQCGLHPTIVASFDGEIPSTATEWITSRSTRDTRAPTCGTLPPFASWR